LSTSTSTTFQHPNHLVKYYSGVPRSKAPSKKKSDNDQKSPEGNRNGTIAILLASAVGLCCIFWDLRKKKNVAKYSRPMPPFVHSYQDQDFSTSGRMAYYRGYLLPEFAVDCINDIEVLPIHDGDVFVCSFPKSGTTWVQYIVSLLEQENTVGSDATQVLYSGASIEDAFPYLEYVYPGVKEIKSRTGSRRIKTHLPYELLPEQLRQGKGKLIYIHRNPKDVSVSYYHFARMLAELKYNQNFANFFDKFIKGKVAYGPWLKHVGSFWAHKDDQHVLVLSYEDLHLDTSRCVRRIANFLDIKVSDDSIEQVCRKSEFSQMKKNPQTNYSWWDQIGLRKSGESQFLRKGCIGDWQNYYTAYMNSEVKEDIYRPMSEQGITVIEKIQPRSHSEQTTT